MKLPFANLLARKVDARKVLIVQTGHPELLTKAIDQIRKVEPDHDYTVLLQRNMESKVPLRAGVTYLVNEGPRPEFIARLRAERFARVWVLYSNDPGFGKLKLLPFVVGAAEVRAMNENLDWFPINVDELPFLAQHLRWRLESSITFAAQPGTGSTEMAAKTVLYPLVLAGLAAWEQGMSIRARLRGATDWKKAKEFKPGE
jgi:hypothetical protein